MKNKNKWDKTFRKLEEKPKKKNKRFSRKEVKTKLQDWEHQDWEKFSGDNTKGESNVPRNDGT
jgi:hypothetical protein